MPKVSLILVFLIIVLKLNAQDLRGFTIWNKNEVTSEPWDDIKIGLAEKIHYKPGSDNLDVLFGEVYIKHQPKVWFDYGAYFRFAQIQLFAPYTFHEIRPMVYFNFSKNLKKFRLSFLNRLAYRSFKELDDRFRHKQSLKLDFPQITDWGMRFYTAEESFYRFGDETNLARFYLGITAVDIDWFQIKAYYGLEKAKINDEWGNADIAGLNLRFSI